MHIFFYIFKDCFELYDKKNKYLLDFYDFRQALHSVGCVINSHILNILVRQYGSAEGYITFDDFILCLVRLRTLIGINTRFFLFEQKFVYFFLYCYSFI